MERKLLYAFRGWIAFVAFMDLGTAFRSYIEKRSFLGDPSDSQYIAGSCAHRVRPTMRWMPFNWNFNSIRCRRLHNIQIDRHVLHFESVCFSSLYTLHPLQTVSILTTTTTPMLSGGEHVCLTSFPLSSCCLMHSILSTSMEINGKMQPTTKSVSSAWVDVR